MHYIIVDYRYNVLQRISRAHSPCRTEGLCPTTTNCKFSLPQTLATTSPLFDFMNLIILKPHINGIMRYLSSCNWRISLTTTSLRSIHVVAYCRISFFLRLTSIPLNVMNRSFFLPSSADEHVGCFYILASVSSTAVSIGCLYLSELLSLVILGNTQKWNCWMGWRFYL